jgi:hypothetical protein
MGAEVIGVGLIRLAPGDPPPWESGALAVDCGETRPRACAQACVGAQRIAPTAPIAMTQRKKAFNPHLPSRFFSILITAISCHSPCVKKRRRPPVLTRHRFHHILPCGLLLKLLRPIMDRASV